jgi:hypothetical protein
MVDQCLIVASMMIHLDSVLVQITLLGGVFISFSCKFDCQFFVFSVHTASIQSKLSINS